MKFYGSLDILRNSDVTYNDPFIVQWEIPNPKTDRTRTYIVFDGVEEYMRMMHRYNTCHEVLMGCDSTTDITGHPAFDIDAKSLQDGWMDKLTHDIQDVLQYQYPNITIPTIRCVWMDSSTDEKLSMHLVIASITLTMWRTQMKVLHHGLSQLKHDYIEALDTGITRTCGSLRLPLNSKVGGIPLQFVDPNHTFIDGLIMMHNANIGTFQGSTMLMPGYLRPDIQCDTPLNKPNYVSIEPDGDYDASLEELNACWDTGLIMGYSHGSYRVLNRVRPGICPISGRIHDHDNAYLFTKKGGVYYGCYRGCSITIGDTILKSIRIDKPPALILDQWIKSQHM